MLATHRLPQQQTFTGTLLHTTRCWRKVLRASIQVWGDVSMSSVVVGWTGRCPDRRDRARLIAHLERLAEVSDSYLRTMLPKPVIAGALPGERRSARANIEHINRTLSGQIMISSGIVPDQNTFLAAASEAELPAIDHPELERASITWLKSARLSGIDFRLYDPNQLNPDADRLSFVFLETEAAPFLDGRLVQVDRRQDHEAEIIRGASFYLRGPDLHLHSYLEDWIDLLFSWVKYFFVGDLWWRRFEEMQGYEDYREVFSDVQNTMGTERAEQATFDAILATFTQHAEHWSGKVAAGGSR
jgi:hypothetical protein